jgi:hypothetical protein
MSIDNYESCPCGKPLKYKWCCKGKSGEPINFHSSAHVDGTLKKLMKKSQIKQCLHPNTNACSGPIVNAHSIQNNGILNTLSVKNHVLMFKSNITDEGAVPSITEVGKNKATTFLGFCNFHDTNTFLPIENVPYTKTLEQNFLFAYRAYAFEAHKKLEQLSRFQNMIATNPELLSYELVVLYYRNIQLGIKDFEANKCLFVDGLVNNKFSDVSTKCYEFDVDAKIAVCSGYFLEYDLESNALNKQIHRGVYKRAKYIFVNVFPQDSKTFVLISCLTCDQSEYNGLFNQIDNLTDFEKKMFFSRLIIFFSENFVVSKQKWSKFSQHQQKQIEFEFRESIGFNSDFGGVANFTRGQLYNFFEA